MKELKTLDEAFEYARKLIEKEEQFERVSFVGNNFIYNIRISGETWSKEIDIRHAKYIQCVNDTVAYLCKDIYNEEEIPEDIKIKFEIKDGSSDIINNLSLFLSEMAKNMNDWQSFISIMSIIAGVAGFFIYSKYTEIKKDEIESEIEKKRLETYKALSDNAVASGIQTAVCEKPIRYISGIMKEDDEISIDGSPCISKKDIRKNLQPHSRSKSKVSYCDGEYFLQKIDFSMGEMILYLSQSGIQFKAYTSDLDDTDNKKLDDLISEKRKIEDMPFPVNLQINVTHTEKRITYSQIVGLGDPRQDKKIKQIKDLF